jgi:hypothetical protein
VTGFGSDPFGTSPFGGGATLIVPEMPARPTARWAVAVGPWRNLPDWELSRATGRKFTIRLSEPNEASFALDGTSRDADRIQELVTDVWLFREGVPLYRGRVGATSDSHDGSRHAVTVSSADYQAILGRRLLLEGDTLTYPQVDQAQLAWNLINTTQSRTGGGLGIVRGIGQTTGVLRDLVLEPGETVGHYMGLLANVRNGFEWALRPSPDTTDLAFDIYHPSRGTDRQVVLDFPGAIVRFDRQVDPGQYANSIRVSGDDAIAPATTTVPDIAARDEGRWEAQVGDTAIKEAATLTARAQAELATASVVTPSWTVTLRRDFWGGPDHIWLGDPVLLAVKSGRLNALTSLRVQELMIDLDDNDQATISLTLGQVPPNRRWRLRRLDARLTSLERR